MAYPVTPLPVETGLYMGGAWVNATTTGGGVLHRQPFRITTGRANWSAEADPAALGFILRNQDGRYSPDLTTGVNYPVYRRNIPVRMGVGLGAAYLAPTDVGADLASTPDTAVLDITGDIDIRFSCRLHKDLVSTDDGGAPMRVAHKVETGADGFAVELLNYLGRPHLNLQWFDNASTQHNASTIDAGTQLPWNVMHDSMAMRVTLDVDSGGGTAGVDFWSVYDVDNSVDSPVRLLSKLGLVTNGPFLRSSLDGLLNDWCAAHGGTVRNATSVATFDAACNAAVPGDVIRVTSTIVGTLQVRGTKYGLGGNNLTTSPAGGTTALPIIITCADGVYIDPNNQANNTGALDLMACSHVWAVGVNVKRSQFGIRALLLDGSAGNPCYLAWNDIRDIGHSGLIMQGWFQLIASSGGTPPAGSENTWGFSSYICAEANTVDNCGVIASQFGECVYIGNGSNPYLARGHHIWIRYNTLTHCRSDYVDIKPGCHHIYVIGNLMKLGAFNLGAGIQILYCDTSITTRPAWYDFDPNIFILFNRIYDGNITNPVAGSSNYAMQASLAGVRVAFNLVWGFSSGGIGLHLRSEIAATNSRSSANEKWWVFNNTWWMGQGLVNGGAPAASPVAFNSGWIDQRNDLGHTSTTGVNFTGTSTDFAGSGLIPAVGATGTANSGAGEGSAYDMASGSGLVGDGTGVGDIDAYINDKDISQRDVPATATNPGAFQVAPSGGHTITFYTSPTIGGTWTQLGSAVVRSGSTTIKANNASLRVGGNPADSIHTPLQGRMLAFELRNGIGGTVVANPDFTAQAVGTTSFSDGAGRTWTIGTGGRITNMRWRFHGELASLPVRWDLAAVDMTAPVEAAGLLRRLRQGAASLESALYRFTVRQAPSVVQYWPCEEDGTTLTQFGAAVGQAPLLVYLGGFPKTHTNNDFPSSAALPEVGTTAWAAWVDSYTVTSEWQVSWLMSIPESVTTADTPVFRVQTTSGLIFELHYRDAGGGDVLLNIINGATLAYSTGWVNFAVAGKPMRWQLQCTTSGANISFQLLAAPLGGALQGVAGSNAATGVAPGAVNLIIVNQDGLMEATAIGHILLQDAVTDGDDIVTGLTAYTGEPAGRRFQRLCLEEGVAFRVQGDPFDTEPMGPQRPLPLADLLQECATADGGLMGEARESVAVSLRTRVSMQSQTAKVFSYSGGQVAGTPELDRDDQGFVNDYTVATVAGGSGRAVLDDGSPLSISQPPIGAGRYPDSESVNCLPSRAQDQAGWRLRISTADEPRVTKVSLETNLPAIVASPTLTEAVLDLRMGDLIQLTGPPANAITGTIRQLVQGARESISMFNHRLDLLTSPASPWDVRTYDVDARYDTASSILASAAAQGATSISVSTLLGPAWVTAVGEFPFDILVGGLRVTVSAISGAGPIQTFTISPLPRALAVGFDVKLADPAYFEL